MDLNSLIPENTATTPTLHDLVPDFEQNQKQGVRGSMFVAGQTTPEEAAEGIKLGSKYNIDPFFAAKNRESLAQNDTPFSYDDLVKYYPGVTQFFQKPENASIAQDDMESVQRIDRSAQHLSKTPSFLKDITDVAIPRGFDAFQKAFIHFGNGFGLIDNDMAIHQIQSIDRDAAKLEALRPAYLEEYSKALQENSGDLSKSIDQLSDSFETMNHQSILKGLKQAAVGGTHTIGSVLDYIQTMATHPKAFAFQTAESLTPFAPSIALSATPAGLGVIGQTLFGALPIFMGAYFDQKVAESGKTIEEVYNDPAVMGEFRDRAFRYGLTMDLATLGMGSLAGKFGAAPYVVAPGLKGAAQTATRVGADVALGTATLAGGELAGRAAAGDKPNIAAAIDMALQNLGLPIAHELVGLGKGALRPREVIQGEVVEPMAANTTPTEAPKQLKPEQKLLANYSEDPVQAARDVAMEAHTAVETLQNLQALDEMGQAVKSSKMATRVPEKVAELIQASGNTGNVFFQVSDWDKYFIEKGLSPAKAAEQILGENAKAYFEAKELGTDIQIPTSVYVSKVAPTEHYDSLLNYVKTSPEGMTFEQASKTMEDLPNLMGELSDKAASYADQAADFGARIEQELIDAGRPPAEAKAAATLAESRMRARSSITGISPAEYIRKYGVDITKIESPQALATEPVNLRLLQKEVGLPTKTDPLGYYSKLKTDVEAMDFKDIPAKDLLGRIQNLPGVKAEELEWTGVTDWLANQEGRVSKEEVTQFLDKNGVRLEQTVLGASEDTNKDVKWGEEETISANELDHYGEMHSDEVDFYLQDEYWVKEETKIIQENHPEYTQEQIDSALEEEASARATDYLESSDHPYTQFRIEEENTGLTIQGNDEIGYTIDGPRRIHEHIEGDLEEAKIQAIKLLQEEDLLPQEIRPHRADQIQWDITKPVFDTNTAEEKAYIQKNLKKFLEPLIKKDAKWKKDHGYPYFDTPAQRKLQAESDARYEFKKRFDNPEVQRNRFHVRTENPFFRLILEGSAKEGFDLTVRDQDELSTTLQAKNIEDAKKKALQYLRKKNLIVDKLPDQPEPNVNTPTGQARFGQYTLDGGTNYREILLKLPPGITEAPFTGGHFENNVLAHIRTKDRSTVDGQKVLGIEEIQSDWHQQGREKGYQEIKAAAPELLQYGKENTSLEHVNGWYRYVINSVGAEKGFDLGEPISGKSKTIAEADKLLINWADSVLNHRSGIPQAPFKNTEAWAMLAFKRILSMAAQDGYDVVTWTPGQAQADRYRLSEHVGDIRYKKEGDVYQLEITNNHGGQIPLPQPSYKPAELKELLGGEVADQILKGDGELDSHGRNILLAKDLKIGGEGHKYFYDKVLPKILQKHLSKLDPTAKVELKDTKQLFGEPLEALGHEYDKVWAVQVGDSLKAKIREGQTLFQEDRHGPRGSIEFGPYKALIRLSEKADASTFIHESFHLWTKEMMDDYAHLKNQKELNPRQQQFMKDAEALLNYVGAESFESMTRDQWEKVAESGEEYLREGKAPSQELQGVFARFKAWISYLYRAMRNARVKLSDEIRAVFDRLVASEEEIQPAEPLFKDPMKSGMSEKQAAEYVVLQKELRDFSENKLRDALLKDLQKQQSADYKAERSKIREQVEAEVNADPVYEALSILQKGTRPDGTELPEGTFPIKLSKEVVKSLYGEDYVHQLPRGIFDKEFGLHPDAAAEMLGFKSGEDLLHSIANAPERTSLIEMLTDARMDPALSETPSVPDEVLKAVHNDQKAKMLRLELEHLARQRLSEFKGLIRDVSRRVPTDMEVRAKAEATLSNKNIYDIRPYTFELAERKAAKEAGEFLTKGDIDQAFQAKRRELFNHELFRAATEAQETISKTIQQFKKVAKADEDLSKSRDTDIVQAIRALLSQYGLGKKTDKSPVEFLDKVFRYDPDKAQTLKDVVGPLSQFPRDYQSLTWKDFQGLKETFDILWSLAKTEREVLVEGKKIDRELVAADLQKAASTFENKKPTAAMKRTVTDFEKKKIDLMGALAAGRTVESLIDQWDRSEIAGPFRKYLFTPVNEAVEKYRDAKVKPWKEVEEALKKIEKNLKSGKIDAPELGYEFLDKSFLLGALLHTGNESNLSKLLRGRGWGELNEDGTLNRTRWDKFIARMQKEGVLTKADYDFVQSVWNTFEGLKDGAQKAHKEMYGYYFDEITHKPFQTPFGEYKGGYYPAKVDIYENTQASIREEKELFDKLESSWAFPTTGKGFTKSRIESYAAPLQLDLRSIKSALDFELRFTHIEPRVKEIAKLLFNPEIRSAINQINPYAIKEILIPWLQRTASQIVTHPSNSKFLDRMFKRLKTATTLQILFLDASNAAQQLTGFLPALTKVPASELRNALFRFTTSPRKMTQEIQNKSAFMRHHTSDQLTHIEESMNDILINPNVFEKVETGAKATANFLSRTTQHLVDVVTWMGAYNHEIQKTPKEIDPVMAEKNAVRAGDRAVRLTQGSAFPEHLSRWSTGTPAQNIFKMFSNFFITQRNLLISEVSQAAEKGNYARAAYVTLVGFLAVAILSKYISMAFSGNFDKNDDHAYADDLIKNGLIGAGTMGLSMAAPGGGSLAYSTINAFTAKNPNDVKLGFSPVFSVAEKSLKGVAELSKAIQKDKPLKGKEIQDIFTLLGLVTNLPLAPVARPYSYIQDVNQRNIQPPANPADALRGLITGQGKKRK